MRSLLLIGAVVFALACAGIGIARANSQLHPPYPQRDAAAAARRNPAVRDALAGSGWDRARVIALDHTHWRVSFFDGPRQVLDVAIDPRGRVAAAEYHGKGLHPPGSTTLWSPALLLLFTAIFMFAVAVQPLRSLRNLDALVIGAGFAASAKLLDDRLVAAHVYLAGGVLAYIAIRCAATGLSPSREPVARPVSLGRFVPVVTAATLAAAVLLVVTSTGASDVAFAGLAGGTLLGHGISPYGHITTEIVHGDTYPLLTYVLYMPFAAISPVRDSFDSLDGALWLNAIALVAAAAFIRRWGARSVLAWLTFPPVLLAASSGGNDVPAAAFVAAALAYAGRERLSTGLLTLAGWVKIAPAVAVVPVLARLRGATLVQAAGVVAALLAAGLVAMLAIGGTDAIDQATTALRFQFERGSWFSVWRQLGTPALQVACQGLAVAFAAVAAVAARRRPDMTVRQLAGLAGAIVALVQLSANSWSVYYLAWLLPFILVALFPPPRRGSPQSEPRVP